MAAAVATPTAGKEKLGVSRCHSITHRSALALRICRQAADVSMPTPVVVRALGQERDPLALASDC